MARRLRIQFRGAIYHLINRGNDRRDLFDTVGAAKPFAQPIGGLPIARHGFSSCRASRSSASR